MDDELRTTQIEIAASLYAANRKPSVGVAYVAWLLFGALGLHRVYVKKRGWFAIPLLGIAGAICGTIAIGDSIALAMRGVGPREVPEFSSAETVLLLAAVIAWTAMVGLLIWDFFSLPSYVERIVTEYENRKRVQLAMMLRTPDEDEAEIQWSLDLEGEHRD